MFTPSRLLIKLVRGFKSRMSGGKLTLLWIVFIIPLISSEEDVEVSCVIATSCILPCSFKASSEIIIHWLRLVDGVHAHSYYNNINQLAHQNPQFENRTSLFDSQISQGNASLLLTNVMIQDSGRYKCYTSTTLGYKESMVNVQVNALISRVGVSLTDGGFTCSSEGIYPQPELTWSTRPPSKHLHNLSSADFHISPGGLYSVSSFLRLPHTHSSVSCSVKTRGNRKKTTLMQRSSVQLSSSTAPLSCSIPTPLTSLSWSFNHRNILKWSPAQYLLSISEEWKPHVMVGESENLTLKDISSQHEGTYVCEASNAEETLITETQVEMEKRSGNLVMIICVVLGVLVPALLALAAVIFCLRKRRQKQEKAQKVEDGKNTLEPLNP
uniref:Ig-like domain-containing protein n=1 Tax=Gouania willdenowi TaxID=441366 RepID=A0A8C5N7U3_GOUWI